MKKFLLLILCFSFLISCTKEEDNFDEIQTADFTTHNHEEQIEFQIRENPASNYCNDQVVPTNDFDIVFQEPTEIPLTISFYIKKDPNQGGGFLGPNVTAVTIPVGTTVKTVNSSCDLPYLIECEVNGLVSDTFYIGVTEVVGVSTEYNYYSNDQISILATRSCSNLGDDDDGPTPGGGGTGW